MPSLAEIRAVDPSQTYWPVALQSPRIVCAGGTSGIGEAVAKRLASLAKAPQIHIVGRNQTAADRILAELKEINREGQYTFHRCDLTLLSESKRLLEELQSLDRVDTLIVSQNVSTFDRKMTTERLDAQFALVYYSRIALISGLRSKFSPGARVMSVLNSVQGDIDNMYWDDLGVKKSPGILQLLKAIKHGMALNDVALQYLGTRDPTVNYFHHYPGYVDTPSGQGLPWWVRGIASALSLFGIKGMSPSDCAEYTAYALLQNDTTPYKTGGACFSRESGQPVTAKKIPTDEQMNKLWDFTMDTMGDGPWK